MGAELPGLARRRNGVQPDERFFATLMGVAGAARKLDLVLRLREDMALDGVPATQVTHTAHACWGAGATPEEASLHRTRVHISCTVDRACKDLEGLKAPHGMRVKGVKPGGKDISWTH
jgi:hypothetical protein